MCDGMAARDKKTGQFTKDYAGGPGRPPGARNKLNKLFFEDLYGAWEARGKEAINEMIETRPHEFVKCVASQMPKDINVTSNPLAEMSNEELASAIEFIRSGLSGSASGGRAKVSRRERKSTNVH